MLVGLVGGGLLVSGCPTMTTRRVPEAQALLAPSEVTLGAMQLLEERPMPTAPDRFEPGGRLLAIEREGRCDVYRSEGNAFIGEYPAASCANWGRGQRTKVVSLRELQPKVSEREALASRQGRLASPDVSREATWKGTELTVLESAGTRTVMRYSPRCEKSCGPIIAVAWSPDGENLAVVHHAEQKIRVLRVRDGSSVTELPLRGFDAVVAGMLTWGTGGVVAVAGQLLRPIDEREPGFGSEEAPSPRRQGPPLRVYVFPELRTGPAPLALEDLARDQNELILDPRGRYVFLHGKNEDGTQAVEGYELRGVLERIVFSRVERQGPKVNSRTEFLPSTWIPGPHPVWETIEVTITTEPSESGDEVVERRAYTAWRLYTAPRLDGPRLERIDMAGPPPADCLRRRVLPDGRTLVAGEQFDRYNSCVPNPIDPTGYLRGLKKDELQRVPDGLKVQVGHKGCLYTDTGLYSCLGGASQRRYVIGTDPLRALFLWGDQLAPLLFRPTLLADFLEGRELPKPPQDQPLGLPPRLRIVQVEPAGERRNSPLVTLEAEDGGSGVGTLRLYRDGEQIGTPMPLHVGRQVLDLIPVGHSCREVRAYACNALGFLCSPVALLNPCSRADVGDES